MVDKKFKALLFDTRSIQKYIYAGNRLRTNIGASYIVDKIFFDVLIKDVLKKMFTDDEFSVEDDVWDSSKDDNATWLNMKKCCVAYIGGGNALILFDSEGDTQPVEVVKKFTRQLLVKRPGLKVGAAHGILSEDDINNNKLSALYAELKSNQNSIFPTVNVPYTGLTLSCEVNGETANFFDTECIVRPYEGDLRFYSQEVGVKSKISTKANESLKARFKKIFELKKVAVNIDSYQFPTSIDELGQTEGENYIAIVHVDGNNMGLKFRGCKSLLERRKLSREIKRKTEGAFADLLIKIICAKDNGVFLDCLKLEEKMLPIRPLIIGGDDVTFICPANMALMFTKTLMENLDTETPENSPEHLTQENSRRMDCCAGIAILPTSYPFFRGYELAEQLCDSAKDSMRKNKNTPSSWLDFAILHGEQAPTLEQIREREYTGTRGNLHFGPYQVGTDKKTRHDIENLILCTAKFLESKKPNPPKGTMAHGKIKELRGILQHGKDDTAKFLRQLKRQNQSLPDVDAWNFLKSAENLLWTSEKDSRTPYIDAIELMDFYLPEVADKWNLM